MSNLLPSPEQIRKLLPLAESEKAFIAEARLHGKQILQRKLPQLAVFVGPCSIHDFASTLEYASRLKTLSEKIQNSFFLVMRLFMEKPRTALGWKGFLYDPYLDGSHDIVEGIKGSRELLLHMAKLRIPCACELLDPLSIYYFSDLITWGFVGARTSASPIHRQLASGLPFPVGFKNSIHGDIDVAISAVLSAAHPHCHLGLNKKGQISAVQTPGNPWTHIVLRGSQTKTNFNPQSIAEATFALQQRQLEPCILIDCGHGNSKKNPLEQKKGFTSAIAQVLDGNNSILGIMLESHLLTGKQPLPQKPGDLLYGLSITDPCLGWEETEEWLLEAACAFNSINSTQK